MIYEKRSFVTRILIFLRQMFFGGIGRILNIFVPIRKKYWAFGADYGYSYRENSKYLLEYVIFHHPEIKCFFVANKRELKRLLDQKGIPCVLNDSFTGVWKLAQVDAVFCSQNMDDVKYAFRRTGRTYYYLTHGQAYKRCRESLPKDIIPKETVKSRIIGAVSHCLFLDYEMRDSCFVPSTSDFLSPFLADNIGNGVPVMVLGMPRNDYLLNSEETNSEKWLPGTEGKLVITYMPTHRLYGRGEVTTIPFLNDVAALEWFRNHNVLFIMKQHPNMILKVKEVVNSDVIKDISKLKIDPQTVLRHTDILISDYSSVFIDFLILKRPIIFYIYDNYSEVEGAMYDITPDFPNSFCYDERGLFECIKKSVENSKAMSPSPNVVSKYHKHVDSNSCKRYFDAVVSDKYGR